MPETSNTTASSVTTRLAKYAMAAAAVPAASASAALVSETFAVPITLANGASTGINFGAQFGSVFNFTFNRYSSLNIRYGTGGYSFYSVANALINFNNKTTYNTAAASAPTSASFVNYNPLTGYFGGNDPARFGRNQNVTGGLSFTTFSSSRGTQHDIFNKNFFYSVYPSTFFGGFTYSISSGTYGAWRQGDRGFLLFQFFAPGGNHFGYFDISIAANGQSMQIHGWAFDDTPGAGISTIALPAPGAVGLAALALGAAGVRRQRRAMAEKQAG